MPNALVKGSRTCQACRKRFRFVQEFDDETRIEYTDRSGFPVGFTRNGRTECAPCSDRKDALAWMRHEEERLIENHNLTVEQLLDDEDRA